MADPPTPPRSSSSSNCSPNVNQGNVRNSDIENNGGVITGNVAGFNTIVGTINITVDSATDLTNNIQYFTARVATAAQRLRDVEAKIRATSQILSSIRDLVVARAARENIPIDRGFRADHGDQTGDAIRSFSGEGERGGSAAGGDERDLDPGQLGDTHPGQDILERSCFRDLIDASKDAAERFDSINATIREAFNRIEPVQRGPGKVELSQEDRQRLSLTERDIDRMESQIDLHRWEGYITLIAFEATMNNNRSENIQTMILEMFKEIRRIGKHFVEPVRDPRPFPEPPPGPRGPPELLDMPIHRQGHLPWTFVDSRPFIFPDLSRLTSLYLGWTFTKGRPDNNTMSTQPSWRWAICTQMALSTEELFLKVLTQTNRRSKLRRSIQDDLKDLLRSRVQRMLVDDLIRGQNMSLSVQYPFLKLKLAGLACKKRKIGWFKDELKSIDVILKTEWSVGSPPHGPADDGGMGPPPHPPPPPPPPPGPGFDDATYGPGRPLGPGGGGGGGGSSGSGYPPSGGDSPGGGDSGPFYHSSQGPESPPRRKTKPPGKTASLKTHPPAGPSKSAPEIVSREPRGYVVRKKPKGKAAASDSHIFVRDGRGHSKIYSETRRPTSSHAEIYDQSDSPSSPSPGSYPETMPAFTRKMTAEEEEQIVNEIFAAWEEGVNGKPREESAGLYRAVVSLDMADSIPAPPSPSPRPPRNPPRRPSHFYKTQNSRARFEDHHHHHPPGKQMPHPPQASAPVPPIGATRRLMMEVEQEAERQEAMEKKMRAMHAHDQSGHLYQTREPHRRYASTHTRHPRTSGKPYIVIDGGVDAYGYEEVPTPHTERAQFHQDFAVPGPSRVHRVPVTETRTRESRFSQVDGWDPRDGVRGPSRRRRESFRSSGADSYATGVPVDGSESYSSIRVMPTYTIERERTRTRPSPISVVMPEPERYERERRGRILEMRSPRDWSSESDSDELLFEGSE